jgi:hypothetical protein
LGLHVVRDKSAVNDEAVQQLRAGFEARCQAAGLRAEFAVEIGSIYRVVARRAAWADMVVLNLTHSPEPHPLARIRPGTLFSSPCSPAPSSYSPWGSLSW